MKLQVSYFVLAFIGLSYIANFNSGFSQLVYATKKTSQAKKYRDISAIFMFALFIFGIIFIY